MSLPEELFLKEHYEYLLIPTCIESSWNLKRNDRDCESVDL